MSVQTSVILNVPEINFAFKSGNRSYSDSAVKAGNVAMLRNIRSNYNTHIDYFGRLFNIPASLTASFIATESGGRNVGPNRFSATGLMQITPDAFYETFSRRLKTNDVALAEQNLVRRSVAGIQFNERGMTSSVSSIRAALLVAFQKPEFNIYAGCLYLDFLIDRFAINSVAQINKVLVGYNAGAYNSVISSNIAIAIASNNLVKNALVPKESRGYLVKILGIDGYLDLILKQGLVTFNS